MIKSSCFNTFIFILLFAVLVSSDTFAIYDKIAIDMTPKGNEIEFCFDFDTKSYSENNPSVQLDKSFLIAVTETPEIFFLSSGKQGLEISTWQQGVEPPVFLPWTKETDSFCLPMLNRDAIGAVDLYCAIGTSFTEALEHNRYIRFFDGTVPSLPQPKREWTVMVYMIGSNLELKGIQQKKYASRDIVEMVNGTASQGSDKINLALTNGGSLRYGWDSVKKSWLYQGQQYLLEDNPTVSMLEPETLESFVLWAVNNFPAEHYALVMWDHGGGVMGFGLDPDGNPKGETISLAELKQVYTNIKTKLGKNLDVVVYDACLMASLEVLEVTSVVADAMSASAENIPSYGIDYSNLIKNLALDNIDTGVDFAKLAKASYIKQCKEIDKFDSNTNAIPHRSITYSVFDLTKKAQFQNTMKTFASSFKSAMENGTYLSYEAASVGIIRAIGYPFKKQTQSRSSSDNHIPIDFGGFLNNLKLRLPLVSDEIELVQNSMQKLVADYEGNVANIDTYSGEYSGRISIDIGTNIDHLEVLPTYFSDIFGGITAYKKRKESDTITPESNLVCSEGVICADFPNWLELYSEDILGLTIYTGWLDSGSFQVSKIEPVTPKENPLSDIKIKLSYDNICAYKLCVNGNSCNAITVKDIKGLLTAEAIVNGVNSILTFCPKNENEWSVCSVVGTSGDNWGREESLYSDDNIKTVVMKKTGKKTDTSESSLLLVDNPDQVVLKNDCSIAGKKIVVSFYGINQKADEIELCEEDECKDSGIIIK